MGMLVEYAPGRWTWDESQDPPEPPEKDESEGINSEFGEVQELWETLKVTNTHSATTRADGLLYFINNRHQTRDRLKKEGAENLEIHPDTVENWLDDFTEAGMLEETETASGDLFYDETLEGQIMREGLDSYAEWLRNEKDYTGKRMKKEAIKGILDGYNVSIDDINELDDTYFEETTLELPDSLHENLKKTIEISDAYRDAINTINDLRGNRLKALGAYLEHPEEKASEIIGNSDKVDLTKSGAKTFIKRQDEERDIVEKNGETYEWTEKGQAVLDTLYNQAQQLKYANKARDIKSKIEAGQVNKPLNLKQPVQDYLEELGVNTQDYVEKAATD